MAETCAIDFQTSISFSTSCTLGGLSPTVLALLVVDCPHYACITPTRSSMFAKTGSRNIAAWGNYRFVAERNCLAIDSEKMARISPKMVEI